jgi:hypothetical protein
MIPDVPAYLTAVFVLTGLLTVGTFLYTAVRAGLDSLAGKLLVGFVILWMIVQSALAWTGFYQDFTAVPPRTFAFGPVPFFLFTLIYLIFFRTYLKALSLRILTLLHIIRVPIEFSLLWLFQSGLIPIEMTFEGRNFDILSGVTAPVVYFLAVRGGKVRRPLLIVWNVAALALLTNIVTIAVLAFPSPFQMVGLAQPNVGVTYFPFVWLPGVIVPVVFFCHVAALYKLLFQDDLTAG